MIRTFLIGTPGDRRWLAPYSGRSKILDVVELFLSRPRRNIRTA
jgi:hypothetical protein